MKLLEVNGEPVRVYHGTTRQFDEFKPKFTRGMQLGFGIHFASDIEFARHYAGGVASRRGRNGRIIAAHLAVKSLLDADSIVDEGSAEFALAEKLYQGTGRRMYTQKNEAGIAQAYFAHALDAASAQRAERLVREAGFDGIRYRARLMGGAHQAGWLAIHQEAESFLVFEGHQVLQVESISIKPERKRRPALEESCYP